MQDIKKKFIYYEIIVLFQGKKKTKTNLIQVWKLKKKEERKRKREYLKKRRG